jgi:type III secretory pathway component EscS
MSGKRQQIETRSDVLYLYHPRRKLYRGIPFSFIHAAFVNEDLAVLSFSPERTAELEVQLKDEDLDVENDILIIDAHTNAITPFKNAGFVTVKGKQHRSWIHFRPPVPFTPLPSRDINSLIKWGTPHESKKSSTAEDLVLLLLLPFVYLALSLVGLIILLIKALYEVDRFSVPFPWRAAFLLTGMWVCLALFLFSLRHFLLKRRDELNIPDTVGTEEFQPPSSSEAS